MSYAICTESITKTDKLYKGGAHEKERKEDF